MTSTLERPGVTVERRVWWRRPWVAPLGFVIVVFLVHSWTPYIGLDPASARVPATTGYHYPALVAHIGFGTVAMVTGFLQVWPWFRRRYPAAHRVTGRVYVFAGVLPASVAGLVVGLNTPFGPAAAVSHVMLAALWFGTTLTGWIRGRQGRYGEHREWMVRSVTLTMSTITNRAWAPLAAIVLMPFAETTFHGDELAFLFTIGAISSWLGWTVPLIVVEWWLGKPRRARMAASTRR